MREYIDNLYVDLYKIREKMFGINSENAIEEMAEEVGHAILEDRIPGKLRYLLFKITNYCNSNCEYCLHAANRDEKEKKHQIPTDKILNTIEVAGRLGVEAMTISGGEPLTHPDILQIIKKAVSCRIIPVLLTNGILLPEYWDDLGRCGLKYVIISMDSVDKNTYEKTRGIDFESALAGIEAAIKMREKYKNVEIHVSAVLTKDNQENLLELIKYMNKRQIKVQIIPYHKRQGDKAEIAIEGDESINCLVKYLLERKREDGLIANSYEFLEHLPQYFKGCVMPETFSCKVGYVNLTIDADMNIRPCWSYMYPPLGNLKDTDLKELWESIQMHENRKKMLRCKCEGCWYLCTSEPSILINNALRRVKPC